MEKSESKHPSAEFQPEHEQSLESEQTHVGELIAFDSIDPALAAKLHLLNDVCSPSTYLGQSNADP